MSLLLHSRKFLVLLLDVAVSVVSYFVTRYVNPEVTKDVLFMIGVLQPVVLAVIGGIAAEDSAMKLAGRTHTD